MMKKFLLNEILIINNNDYKLPLLKRFEMHNNIDIDGILNNHKTRKRKTMYPKDWSDEEEVKPEYVKKIKKKVWYKK